jgi:hypothetical protein
VRRRTSCRTASTELDGLRIELNAQRRGEQRAGELAYGRISN